MLAFELKLGEKEIKPCEGNVCEGVFMFTDLSQMNMVTLTDDRQPYTVMMIEDHGSESINFFIKDGFRAHAVKGDVKFFFESRGVSDSLAQTIIQNSIMGAIWKDKKLRHASPKGFTWTDDLDKADALIFDLELLNTL
jgi:hypothetical protein